MAYELTGNEKYAEMAQTRYTTGLSVISRIKEHGEWFGYLHRDGRISSPLKGNIWKGPFHIPRMYLMAWKTLEQLKTQ